MTIRGQDIPDSPQCERWNEASQFVKTVKQSDVARGTHCLLTGGRRTVPMMTKLRICTCSRDVSKEGNMRRLQNRFPIVRRQYKEPDLGHGTRDFS